MDPNMCLAELRKAISAYDKATNLTDADAAGFQMAEYSRSLDDWLSKGGFLPDAWQDGR